MLEGHAEQHFSPAVLVDFEDLLDGVCDEPHLESVDHLQQLVLHVLDVHNPLQLERSLLPDGIDLHLFSEAVEVIAGIANADALDAGHQLDLDVPVDLLQEFAVAQVDLPQVFELLHDFLVDFDEVLLPPAGLLRLADQVQEVLDL